MKLYVGNLSYSTGESDLRDLFAAYGAVESVAVITDRDSGRSKGFGFVEFGNDTEGNAAIAGSERQGSRRPGADRVAGAAEDRGRRRGSRSGRRRRRWAQPVLRRRSRPQSGRGSPS